MKQFSLESGSSQDTWTPIWLKACSLPLQCHICFMYCLYIHEYMALSTQQKKSHLCLSRNLLFLFCSCFCLPLFLVLGSRFRHFLPFLLLQVFCWFIFMLKWKITRDWISNFSQQMEFEGWIKWSMIFLFFFQQFP